MASLSKQTIHHNTYIKISLTSAVYWSVTSPSNSGLPPSRPSSTLARDLCWRGIVAHFDTLDGNCVAPVGFQSSKLWDQLQCWKSDKSSSCWLALLSLLSFSHSGKWEWSALSVFNFSHSGKWEFVVLAKKSSHLVQMILIDPSVKRQMMDRLLILLLFQRGRRTSVEEEKTATRSHPWIFDPCEGNIVIFHRKYFKGSLKNSKNAKLAFKRQL